MLITFSSNDLSSRLLKIEQKSTIASFFLKLVQNGFLYRLKRLQILNSGCGVYKKSFSPYWIGFLFSLSSDCLQRTVKLTYQMNWPLQMSPVAGTNYLDPIFEKALKTLFVM